MYTYTVVYTYGAAMQPYSKVISRDTQSVREVAKELMSTGIAHTMGGEDIWIMPSCILYVRKD